MSGKTGLDKVEVYFDMLLKLDIYGSTWSALSHHLHLDPSPAPASDCANAFGKGEKNWDLNSYIDFVFSSTPVLKMMCHMSTYETSWNKQCNFEIKIEEQKTMPTLILLQLWKSVHTMTWIKVDWSCPSCCSFSSSPWSCPAGKWWCSIKWS